MKIVCTLFVTLIVLINVLAGLKQARLLFEKKIRVCDGWIITSRLRQTEEQHDGNNKLMIYWPAVEFEYEASGRRMRGDRISFATSGSSDKAAMEKKLRCYRVGKQVKVFFNPDDPSEAWLKNPRKHIWTFLCWASGMLVFGVAMGLMIWMLIP